MGALSDSQVSPKIHFLSKADSVLIPHGTARTMPFSETQNAVSLANKGDAE